MMRRLLVLLVILVSVGGLMRASAALLQVNAGTLQVLSLPVQIDVPTPPATSCDDHEDGDHREAAIQDQGHDGDQDCDDGCPQTDARTATSDAVDAHHEGDGCDGEHHSGAPDTRQTGLAAPALETAPLEVTPTLEATSTIEPTPADATPTATPTEEVPTATPTIEATPTEEAPTETPASS